MDGTKLHRTLLFRLDKCDCVVVRNLVWERGMLGGWGVPESQCLVSKCISPIHLDTGANLSEFSH